MAEQNVVPLAINTATTRRQWSLPQAIEGYVRAGISAIGPWREQLSETGLSVAARHLRDAGLPVTGLCRGGMFTAPDRPGIDAAIEDNRRAIEEAAAIGAPVLVLLGGGLPPGSTDLEAARGMVLDGIAAVLPDARAAGVSLAIEPLHPIYTADRNVICTLDQAVDCCELLDPDGSAGLGVIIDAYHVWWDPRLGEALARAVPRALGFHINDWLVSQKDPLNDRGMMGDGVIDLAGIGSRLKELGDASLAEVELFSDRWWAEDPSHVVQTCLRRWAAISSEIDGVA